MNRETITIYTARIMFRNGVQLSFGSVEDPRHPGWWRLYTRGMVVVNSRGKERIYKSFSSLFRDLVFVFGSRPFNLSVTPIFQPEEADK